MTPTHDERNEQCPCVRCELDFAFNAYPHLSMKPLPQTWTKRVASWVSRRLS